MGKGNEIQTIETTALQAITEGEINQQIATAHKFPRSLEAFNGRAAEMVATDEETAASCIYARPVGKEGGKQKFAEGMSVRMAEIVGASYGNLRAGAMLIEQTDRQVKARGFAHDLESNFASTSEVIEATVDKYGKPYSERMRVVVAKAALAKARRDAIFQVVPKALCKSLENLARKTAIGTTKTMAKRRDAVMAWVDRLGVGRERVFAAIGVSGVEDIGLKQLELLTGIKTAIKEGDTTIDESFPMPTGKPNVRMPRATEQAPVQEAQGQAGETAVQEAKEAAQAATVKSEPVKLGMAEFVAAEKALLGKLKKHGISPVEAEGKAIKAGFGQDIKETERVPYLQFLASLMGEEYNAA